MHYQMAYYQKRLKGSGLKQSMSRKRKCHDNAVMESFFGIPGLGSFTIDAINAQDFAIVRTMVFVGTVLYVIGLILTDVAYTIADPRIRLK